LPDKTPQKGEEEEEEEEVERILEVFAKEIL